MQWIQNRIIGALEKAPTSLSQLAIMCECYGYHHAHGKLLYFSVKEREYLQAHDFDGAQALLEEALDEADADYNERAEKLRTQELKRRRQKAIVEKYTLVEPPKEVVKRPATRRLISGDPLYKSRTLLNDRVPGLSGLFLGLNLPEISVKSATLSSYGKLFQDTSLLGGALSDSLSLGISQPPVYEEVSEERGPSPYAVVVDELDQKLKRYPKVVWQKLELERRFVEDENIAREVQKVRQATRRALNTLLKKGRVKSAGKRSDATYYLTDKAI